MKARAFLFFCIAGSLMRLPSFAQTTPCDSVYTIADEMPKFGESNEDFGRYVLKNLKINKCARYDIRLITWTIDSTGHMVNIDVPGLEGECKQNIIEQLKAFPLWKPGKLKGKPVCVKMMLRICIKT
jgi:hypothetical protein